MESVAHLMVMLNFSSNFLVYCSVSNQFKKALSKICFFFICPAHCSPASEYQTLVTNTVMNGQIGVKEDSPTHEMVEMEMPAQQVPTQLVIESFTESDPEFKICRL